MSDITLSLGVQTGSLRQSIESEVAKATEKPYKIKLQIDPKSIQLDKKQALKLDVGINKSKFLSAVNDAIRSVSANTKQQVKIQIQVDKAYLQSQVQSALKDLGKFATGSTTSGQGTSSGTNSDGEKLATQKQINQAKKEEMRINAEIAKQEGNLYKDNAYVKNVQQAQREVAELTSQIEKLTAAQASAKLDNLSVTKTSYQTSNKTKILSEGSIEQEQALKTTYAELAKVQKDLLVFKSGKNQPFYQDLQKTEEGYRNLTKEIKTGKMAADDYANTQKKLAAGHAEATQKGNEQGYSMNSLSNKLQRFKMHLTTITSMVRAFQMLRMVIRPIVNAVTEVDTALTQLKIVTQENDTVIKQYANDIMNVANRTAGSVKDLINSTTTFSRLGYSLEESTDLAEYTQMLENVGDIDESTATSAITAIIKAFDAGTDDLQSIMDRMVETGNNFPISVSEIAEGLNNAGSMLAMGTDKNLNQSIALLTAANTTIQNVSKSSTGLRTIVARIRNVKAELDDLGETMTEAEYDDMVKMLTENQVSLTDENGQLRNTYDILSDLSKAWKDMSDNEQAALAKTLSGTRQQNVFASLMQNFEEASGAMTAMADSEGAMSDANDIYMDSIKAHVQQLKNVFTEFSQSALSKDLIDTAVDLAKAILQIVSAIMKVSKFLGGIKTIIPLVITLVTVLKGATIAKGIDNAIKSFKNFGTLISTVFKSGVTSAGSFKKALSGIEGQAVTTGAAINAALGIIGLIAAAVSLVSSVISNAVNEHRQALQSVVDSGSEAAKTSDNIYELYTAYQEAKAAGQDVTESQKALKDALRESGASFDNASESATNYGDKLEQLTLQQLEYETAVQRSGIEAEKQLLESSKEYDKFWSDFAFKQLGLTDVTAEVSSKANIGSWAKKVLGIDSLDIDYLATHLDELKTRVVELQDIASNTSLDSQESKNAERALAFVQGLDDVLGDYAVDLNNLQESIARISFMKLDEDIPKTEKEFETYRESLISAISGNREWSGSADDAANAADNLLSSISDFNDFYDTTTSSVQTSAEALSTAVEGFQGLSDVVKGTTESLDELNEKLEQKDYGDNLETRIGHYKKLLEEVQEGNWGGRHYAAYADYFGVDLSESIEKQGEAVSNLGRYFEEENQGLLNFFNDIANGVNISGEKATKEVGNISKALKDAGVELDSSKDLFQWDPSKLDEFAAALGITRDALADLLGLYIQKTPPSEWLQLDPSTLNSWMETLGVIEQVGGEWVLHKQQFDSMAETYGLSADDLLAKLQTLSQYQNENGESTLVIDTSDSSDHLTEVKSQMEGIIEDGTTIGQMHLRPSIYIEGLQSSLTGITELQNKMHSLNPINTGNVTHNAKGTQNAKPGLSLLGDEYSSSGQPKPELVVSKDRAYLAGVNGPVVSMLNAGDIVYTYAQTKKILGNSLNKNIGIPAFATGKDNDPASLVTGGKFKDTLVQLANAASEAAKEAGNTSTTGTGTGTGTGDNTSTKDEETWFEKLYKKKNHLRKMDQLSDKKYFKWLNSAYKLAYSQGIMELDDYRKYREEVYEGYKKTFTDAYDKKNHLRNMDKLSDEKYLKWLRKAVAKAKKNGKLTAQESWKYEEEILKLSTDIQKKKVQEQIAAKQHQVAMNKITENNYYTWLNSKIDAWYKKGKITLDEYRKYQEEIYNYNKNKAKEVLDDYYTDLDHYITMLENRGEPVSKIIEADKKGMTQASAEIQELMLQGKNNNDEEVQKLQGIWWKYYKDWEERTKDANDSAKESTEKLIDYTVDMLKKGLEKEKEVLNKRLSAIQEFYSKQKELLQDSYDEDKYLEEQAEKRKAVSDLELQLSQLEYDNSAWAQKRRLELQQQLTDAKKDLDNFEKEHALKTTQSMLDDLQKLQEEEMNNEIDVLEEKLDDEAQLRRDALQLIAENPQETYARMVEYEDLYGTGDIQNVIDLWNEAAEARDNYYNINGSYYQGLTLGGYKYSEGLVDVSSIWAGYGSAATTKKTAQNNAKNRMPYVAPYFTPSTFLSTYGSDNAILTNQAILPAGVSTKNKKANDAAWMQSLMKLISGASNSDEFMRSLSLNNLTQWSNSGTMPQISGGVGQSFTMGNIIINGNADSQTISQIRREQRNQLDTLLKELNKLNK